jgi:hypothetical protein
VGLLLLVLAGGTAIAQDPAQAEPPSGPVFVSEPAVPTITPAVIDLPDWKPDPGLFGLEMKRRDDFGFIPIPYAIDPRVDPLLDLNPYDGAVRTDSFNTPIHNFTGQTTGVSPPDTNGDVGPAHYLQSINQSVSTVQVLDKTTGANLKTFTMQSLATAAPCNSGFCDPVVLYDRMANRWLISELPSNGGNVCVYVSTSGDPTGTWYAYAFAIESSLPDYPKYGVWPQGENGGSYLIGVNAGSGSKRDLIALDRAKMLAGQPATFQKFSVPNLANSGFQLVLPATVQGKTPPPDGEPAIFMRPHDDEAQDGASTPSYDLMDMWALGVDWATPANSLLTPLSPLQMGDYDMTLCGMGGIWNCMPQPGTSQKIDPIREPIHFPLPYRNFGDHQTLVGTYAEDVDGTDHAALRWFEFRKTGGGAWSLFQEGLVGGEAGVHRSVGSIAMDGSGNIAIGYTRTGGSAPYYPSIYYKGRLSTDPAGTMPQGEYVIADATTSKTNNERWGDYAGMAVDPADDCTFWFTTEYGGSGNTKVAAFKFDACGCLAVPAPPVASASAPQGNRIDVNWDDSATATITQYFVHRSTVSGGPYTQIAAVADSSPGAGYGPGYTYHDDTVSGGTRYFYLVKSTDGVACTSLGSSEATALATGQCRLAPSFAGLAAIANPAGGTCTLNLSWSAGSSNCASPIVYDLYRSTTPGFTPAPVNRIASGVPGTAFSDGSGILSGVTYYYVVRALDTSNGIEDANTSRRGEVPTGPYSSSGWADTFEGSQSGGGFDQPGWTHNAINGTTNWAWSTFTKHDGAHSWFAADVATVSDKVLVSPAFGVGPATTLSFYHTFRFEGSTTSCNDAGTLEYSADGGTTWTVVPDADFTAGGFNGTANASGSNPIGGKRAWCGGIIATMQQTVLNLGADADVLNRTIRVRWHEGDGSSNSSTGWYVDTVVVNNSQVPAACTTGTGTLTVSNNGPVCAGATLDLSASYSQAGASYGWSGPNGFTSGVQNPSFSNAGTAASGTYYATATVGGSTVASDATVVTVLSEGSSCSDGNACTSADACTAGACAGVPVTGPPEVERGVRVDRNGTDAAIAWNPAAGAASSSVLRGLVSALPVGSSPGNEICLASRVPVPTSSVTDTGVPPLGNGFWYLVRGESACGAGPYGYEGQNGAPTVPEVSAACP